MKILESTITKFLFYVAKSMDGSIFSVRPRFNYSGWPLGSHFYHANSTKYCPEFCILFTFVLEHIGI